MMEKVLKIARFMGEQTERENVVAWLRSKGDSKTHGTDWRAYYEAADAIELGEHEGAAQVADRFANDAAAKAIYDGWSDQPGWVPWVHRGNSDMQEKARAAALPTSEEAGA